MDDTNSSAIAPSARRTLSTAILSMGCSFTGAGTVMLGVLLPTLSQRWGLRDDQAGLLLFLQFAASGLGAIVTGLNRIRSLAIGYGVMATALAALFFRGPRLAYGAIFFYGLGLGMAMTSTSLLFSDRWVQDRAAKLEWLNFVWSAGATAGPVCFLFFLRGTDFRLLFIVMFSLSIALLAWVAFMERETPQSSRKHKATKLSRLCSICVCTACVASDDHGRSGGIAQRMAHHLFATSGDAEPGNCRSCDVNLLAWRNAEPARFFDTSPGQSWAPGGAAMGNLGRDRVCNCCHRCSTSMVDSRGRRGGWCVHRSDLSVGPFLPA